MSNNLFRLSALALAATLAACEGGGSSGSSSTDVNASGAITGFGSVVVADERYDTRNVRIVSADDGSLLIANPSDDQVRQYLGLGQVVRVRASSADDSGGSANTISVDSELVGTIDEIDAANLILVVNRQRVTLTPDTIIDDSIIEAARNAQVADDTRLGDLTETLDDLFAADMLVEISGFPTDTGLEATRIEDVNNRDRIVGNDRFDDGEAEVKGFVENRDDTQFEINGLVVLYEPGDLDAEDFGSGGLSEDQFVEVKGDLVKPDPSDPSTWRLNANRIELEDDLFDDDFERGRIEIEGVVQRVVPDATPPGGVIVIDGFEIRVPDVNLFEIGLKVEIKGTRQEDGTIVLTRIDDESEDTVRTEDLIANDNGGLSWTTRLGLTVAATNRTRVEIEGGGDPSDPERIEARGFPFNNDTLWTRIEVERDDDQDCRLRGPAENLTGDAASFTFEIVGVTIDVSQVSESNFEGTNGLPIGRQAFFDELNDGDVDIVEAKADSAGCNPGTLTAREVQFKHGRGDDDGGDDDANDNEIVGTVSNVTADSFVIGGRTITVNADTLIDDSMIEEVCNCEIPADKRFGDVTEATLQELLAATPVVEVHVGSGDVALRIEDL